MLLHQRREPEAAGNGFSFSKPGEMEYETWAERIKSRDSNFGKPSDAKLGAWTRRVPRGDGADEDEHAKADGDRESGTPSPELWKQRGTPVTQSADSSPVRSHGYYDRDSRLGHINHSARAQAIAKYRQEMLDLVRGIPETAYELSLRDIVESPKLTKPLQETVEDKQEVVRDEKELEAENETTMTKKKKKKNGKKGERRISRSESMETGGLLLNMFFPMVAAGSRGRKSTGSSPGAKVSPKPALAEGEKIGEREWWSEEFGPMTSSSGSGSSSSSTGSGRGIGRKLKACYPFFQTR